MGKDVTVAHTARTRRRGPRTSSKSALAEGRSEAKRGSPRCFSILSPCTTVVLTTLLTRRPSTGSAWNLEDSHGALGSDSVT